MNRVGSRRAVSEIIAALLIVCITVSAATLFAAYASGIMGAIQKPVSQPYTEQLTIDYYCWGSWSGGYCNTSTITSVLVTIRNDGAATITFADFFIQGFKATSVTPSSSGCPSASSPYYLNVQSVCTLTISVPTGLTVKSGIAYSVKFVATDGSIFTFSCIAGSYTH